MWHLDRTVAFIIDGNESFLFKSKQMLSDMIPSNFYQIRYLFVGWPAIFLITPKDTQRNQHDELCEGQFIVPVSQ